VKHCSAVVYKKDLKCFVCVLNGEIKALSAKIEKNPDLVTLAVVLITGMGRTQNLIF
jgi:hypothetical protein